MHALHTRDDLPLHLRQWTTKNGARGVVLIVHGLGEHIGRYARSPRVLIGAGWDVAGYDHRGHGASGGARGAIAQPDSMLDDLARGDRCVAQRAVSVRWCCSATAWAA